MSKIFPIRIERENGPTLEFEGNLLASVEPHVRESARGWTKLDIYRSDSGKIILSVTKCRDKRDRTYAMVSSDWQDVKRTIEAGGKDGLKIHWSSLLSELLRKVAENDSSVEEILIETV
jgi:hypothetical protein